MKLKNNMTLLVRRPMVDDADDIVKYLNAVGGESDNLLFGKGEFRFTVEQEKSYIENINKDGNGLMLLGEIENEIVSIAIINCPNRKRISHNAEISLSVKKEYWNLGIGRIMMGELVKFANNHENIRNVHLAVRADNFSAIRIYEKLGFKRIGIHKNYLNIDGNYFDNILMELVIK